MKDTTPDLGRRIAARVRDLRAARRMSLETLATRSGVSRSMISLIERGESSPTAVVLDKLATALGVVLASLFDAAAKGISSPVARFEEQPVWKDPASAYRRRNVSPPGIAQPMQIVEVEFPPNARVTFDTGTRNVRIRQQIWVLQGAIDISHGKELYRLGRGDCLAMQVDRPVMFHNPTKRTTRYAVVIAAEAMESA